MNIPSTLHLCDAKDKEHQLARVRFSGKGLDYDAVFAIYYHRLLSVPIEPTSLPLYSEQMPLDSNEASVYTVTGYVKRRT